MIRLVLLEISDNFKYRIREIQFKDVQEFENNPLHVELSSRARFEKLHLVDFSDAYYQPIPDEIFYEFTAKIGPRPGAFASWLRKTDEVVFCFIELREPELSEMLLSPVQLHREIAEEVLDDVYGS